MNKFERFDTLLDGKKPDKMPFYFPTIACSAASEILGREVNSGGDTLHFREELSWLGGENAHNEFVHKYHEDAIELNRKLNADIVRETWRCKGRPSKKLDDYTLLFGDQNGPHIIKRFFPEYQSYGVIEDTTQPGDVDELKQRLVNQMKNDYAVTNDMIESIYKDQLDFKKLADPYFPSIVGGLGIGFPMTNTVWLEACIAEAELLCEFYIFQAEKMLPHVKWLKEKGYRFINGGADIATNIGPIFSPKTFETVFVPALRMLSDECRKHGMIYCYRTDGNIWDISDAMFCGAKVQAFGEVDRHASMTVGRLREKYPDIIILGNISSAALCVGTQDDVRKETRDSLIESNGYNYIPGPSNAVVHGTKAENVYAMVDEINIFKP